jgi:hypothetical protein
MSNQDSAMAPETLSFLHESRKTHLVGGFWADSKGDWTRHLRSGEAARPAW